MVLPIYSMFPLAEQDRMQDLFRAFRATQAREGMDQVLYVLLIVTIIAAVALVVSRIIRSRKRRRGYASPLGLFLELCRAHKLKWSQRWLLWRLARIEQLSEPARLFLEPEWYAAGSLPRELRQRAGQLKSIRDRLFADVKESLKSIDNKQAHQPEPIHPVGAELPALQAAPDLDLPPWQASALPPPLPLFSNTSEGQPV